MGNLSRNKYYGPSFKDFDFSIFKNFSITERIKLQLRGEIYNIVNRINLASGAGSSWEHRIRNRHHWRLQRRAGSGPWRTAQRAARGEDYFLGAAKTINRSAPAISAGALLFW